MKRREFIHTESFAGATAALTGTAVLTGSCAQALPKPYRIKTGPRMKLS